jgi:hypothetical protein
LKIYHSFSQISSDPGFLTQKNLKKFFEIHYFFLPLEKFWKKLDVSEEVVSGVNPYDIKKQKKKKK